MTLPLPSTHSDDPFNGRDHPSLDPAPFDRLADDIRKKAKGRRIIYVPNPGNIGDGLIRHAAKLFLFDHGIAHTEINIGFRAGKFFLLPFLLRRDTFFIYGGGGAWHAGCDFGYRICRFISHFTSHLLVLPSTYAFEPKGSRGTLYRRDEGISVRHAPGASFCHDMALYLAARERRSPWASVASVPGSRLTAFRTDNESDRSPDEIPGGNIDISRLGDHMTNAEAMFAALADYEVIETDRLHVAIAGVILNRHVILHCGNYPKIADIHAASLTKIGGAKIDFRID